MNQEEISKKVSIVIQEALLRLGSRERGEWRVRPSGIHRCLRAQVLAAELDPAEVIQLPAKTALAFEVGTAIHQLIQGALPELPAEEQWHSPNMHGHSDLRIVEDQLLIDLKTINVEGYLDIAKNGPKPEHVSQVSWYAHFAGCKSAAVVYINKNGSIPPSLKPRNLDVAALNPTFQVCPITVDLAVVEEAEERAATVFKHKNAGTLPAFASVPECRWCEVAKTCHAREAESSSQQQWQQFHSKVVGVTFRDAGFDLHDLAEGEPLQLVWEPDNQHGPRLEDGTAAAVKVLARGVHIGYLPASNSPTATVVATHFKKGGSVSCKVSALTGGTDGKNKGINVDVQLHGNDF